MAQYSDNFIDGAKTLLTDHTPTSGEDWSVSAEVNTHTDNHIRGGTSNRTTLRKGDDLGTDEMAVSVYGRMVTSGTFAFGVCARMAAGDFNNQYEAYIDAGTTLKFDKVVDSVRTNIATETITSVSTTYHTLTLVIGNGTQKVYLDSVLVVDETEPDATLAGNNYAGLVIHGSGADNSNVKMIWFHSLADQSSLTVPSDLVGDVVASTMALAQTQVTTIEGRLAYNRFPDETASAVYGDYSDEPSSWWTCGYFTQYGSVLHQYTKDVNALNTAFSRFPILELVKTRTTDPDTAFMCCEPMYWLYEFYGLEYAKTVLLTAAATINSNNYNSNVGGYHHAWPDGSNITIIADSHSCVWLLAWAAENGGAAELGTRAASHFALGAANHIKPDGSTYHVVEYDGTSGAVLDHFTEQGFSDDSCWSRGQAWTMYGFARMFQVTGDTTYLTTARLLCDYTVNHLPQGADVDTTPPWDFDDTALSNPQTNAQKDTSAGALMAWTFLLMSDLETDPARALRYRTTGQQLIVDLVTHHIGDADDGESILKHGTVADDEHDMSIIYADNFLIHALVYYMRDMGAISYTPRVRDRGRRRR